MNLAKGVRLAARMFFLMARIAGAAEAVYSEPMPRNYAVPGSEPGALHACGVGGPGNGGR